MMRPETGDTAPFFEVPDVTGLPVKVVSDGVEQNVSGR